MLEYPLRTYQSPTRLVQRLGAIRELGTEAGLLGIRRPLLVTDPGVKAAGLLDTALEVLRGSDCEPVVFDRVRANPGVELVDAGAAEYRSQGCDGLVAIGGGSSIDTAKGIRVVAAHDGSILDYEWGQSPIAKRIPPVMSGFANGPDSAGAAHAMSQTAGGVHDAPHGALTARLLGPVMEYNHAGEPERFARMASAFGLDVRNVTVWRAAEMAVEYVHQLTVDVEIPSLEELGFTRDEIPMLADKAASDPQSIGNPRDVDAAAYRRIYARAFDLGKGRSA